MKKRVLSIVLILCMVLTVMPTTPIAVAAAGVSGSPIYDYDISTGALTVDGTGTVTQADVNAAIGISGIHTLTIGKNVTRIEELAFLSRELNTVIVFGKTVIEENAFQQNTALESVYLYDCEYIDSQAFSMCGSYTVYYYTTNQAAATFAQDWAPNKVPLNGTCGATASDNVTWKLSADGTMTISGTGAMADYSAVDAPPWQDLRGLIKKAVIANGVTNIGSRAFQDCTSLTSTDIADSVTTIGGDAFWKSGLTSAIIPNSVTYVGSYAFAYCSSLKSILICGDTFLDNSLFAECINLNSIYLFGNIDFHYIAPANPINPTVYGYDGSSASWFATTHNYTFVPLTLKVTGGTPGKDFTYDGANGVLTVLSSTPLEIKNMDASTATNHRIVVAKDVDANITLAGVNIENSSASPFEIEKDSEGNVTITLADGTTNKLSAICNAALQKEGDGEGIGKLTIQGGTLGTGELFVTSATGAGIGSSERLSSVAGNSDSVANITISGGKITAIISGGGAGIGSGSGSGSSGGLSDLTITGGTVTVKSASGAGIGSGFALSTFCGTVSGITIKGGTVTASSTYGTDIGSGWGYASGNGIVSNIVITDGSVKASSLGCTPTDGKGNNVYLVTIPNPNGNPVIIDGKLWTPLNHTALDPTDTNLYAYSTTENATRHTVTFNDGTNTTSYFVAGKLGDNAPTPTVPTGYTSFDGWYTAQESGTKFDFTTAITSDITLYARFTPNTYTVSYNAGANGTGTVAASSKTHGVDFTLSSDIFTRTGYIQTGWATTDDGEKVYDLGGSYTANAAVTLYPVWTIKQYTITVKPENGEADITITQDYNTAVTAPTLTRDGYAFTGWDKTFPATMPAESMEITAKWKDSTAPVISGIVNGEIYCAVQMVTVSDNDGISSVTVNGNPVTPDTNGQFTLSPAESEQKIVVTDKAGNQAEMTVTVNDGHTGGTADCTHKAICEVCGEEYGEVDSGNHDLENIRGNAATVTEKGNREYWHCKDCDGNFSDRDGKNEIDLKDTVLGKLPPAIIDGKGQSLTEGEARALTFRSNAAYSDFIRVELDGETVDGRNYTKKEGSTIVTLKADYVATLSAGEHTLGIVSESGTATTTFTVHAKAVDTDSPQTGADSHMALWLVLLFVSGGAVVGTAVYGRKKKRFVK